MKVIAIISGGMDSATLLYQLLHYDHEVEVLTFDYGQRHRKEIGYAAKICTDRDVPWKPVDCTRLSSLIAGQSSQVNPNVEVPEGHYADENMKTTVVPNRNMIMLSIAIGHCISREFDAVAYGAHAGDHAIYPDCRRVFTHAMQTAAALCDWRDVKLLTPFVDKTKADIAGLGDQLGVPFQDTWTCYKGLDLHCGKCGACVERQEAFIVAGIIDSTEYAPA